MQDNKASSRPGDVEAIGIPRAIAVEIPDALQVCKDPHDDKFLETAVIGEAEFFVTKNLKHFPAKSFQNVRIVTIAKFLSELEKPFSE